MGTGYVVLPPAGLYRQIWEYYRVTLAMDLAAHLLYGTTTAATFAGLASADERNVTMADVTHPRPAVITVVTSRQELATAAGREGG